MNKRFHQIYQEQYEDYIFENRRNFSSRDEHYLVLYTRIAIDKWGFNRTQEFLSQNLLEKPQLRPDAKLFLLNNFHQMVIKPIMRNYEMPKEIRTMRKDCEKDIKTILDAALKQTRTSISHSSEISGHVVLLVMDRLWRELRMTRMEIWG